MAVATFLCLLTKAFSESIFLIYERNLLYKYIALDMGEFLKKQFYVMEFLIGSHNGYHDYGYLKL